ncbi:MAG: radical SAM protein [Magnetococcales bacterium]|nr:radical SAM protein [Magnetococcales bacterium]
MFMNRIWRYIMPSPLYRYRANRVLDWLTRHKVTLSLAPPRLVYLELASVCNLRCQFCPTGVGRVGREPGFMKWETFKTVVDDLASIHPESFFHMWGESLLHPEFNRFVRYAKDHGFVEVFVNTNGNIDRDENWFRELVASGIDVLQVDIDGNDQETYGKYRHNGKLELIFDFINNIQRVKLETNSKTPIIIPFIVVNEYNKEQLSALRTRLNAMGLPDIKMRNIKNFIAKENADSADSYSQFNAHQSGFGGLVLLKQDDSTIRHKSEYKKVLACPSLWSYLHVTSQGKYVPCCQSYNQEDVLDSVDTIKPMAFWYSKRMSALRRMNLDSPQDIPICRSCGFIRRRISSGPVRPSGQF